jgi:hypothetical protein
MVYLFLWGNRAAPYSPIGQNQVAAVAATAAVSCWMTW